MPGKAPPPYGRAPEKGRNPTYPDRNTALTILQLCSGNPQSRIDLITKTPPMLASQLHWPSPTPAALEDAANFAFDWLLANGFTRRASGQGFESVQTTPKGRAALHRKSLRECDIFISHASVDAPLASELKAALEAGLAYGEAPGSPVRCFCSSDPTDLPPGSIWSKEIQAALKSAALVLVIVSPASLHRPWVWFEIGTAWFDEGREVMPLCLGGIHPGDLPAPISERQALDISGADQLVNIVATKLGCRAATSTSAGFAAKLAKMDNQLAAARAQAVAFPLVHVGESVILAPACPSDAQQGGFCVDEATGDGVTLSRGSSKLTVPRSAIKRVERAGGPNPTRLLLEGRAQWLTLSSRWEYFPEPPVDGYGLPLTPSVGASSPDLETLQTQARLYGVNLTLADPEDVHTRPDRPGEIIYFNNGRYLKTTGGKIAVRGR